MTVLIIILIAGVVGLTFYLLHVMRLFRIEIVPVERLVSNALEEVIENEDAVDMGENEGENEGEGEEEVPELVDLVEYFNSPENRPERLAEPPPESDDIDYEEANFYDKLTHLLAGRSFISECNKFIAEAYAKNESCAVAYFDIDRFRFINSVKGYSLGDYVLTKLAQESQRIFPRETMLTRISADHFAALFPVGEEGAYEAFVEDIRVFSENIKDDIGVKSTVRFCVGISEALNTSHQIEDMDVLVKKANITRHCLKMARNEAFGVFNETMVSTFLYGESATDDYTENQYGDDFVIYFQPMVDLVQGHMWCCNTLVRWATQESLGEAVTAENGRIPTNNIKVIYHACRSMSRWRKAGREPLPVCINIPELEFFKSNLDEFLLRCMSEFQLEPRTIIGVVEAATLKVDHAVSIKQMNKLKESGIQLAVSGVGLRTRSFDFLDDIPFNYVKCRRSLARDIHKQPEKGDAIRAVMSFASSRGAKAVFEGVDSLEQLKALQRMGVELIEGRYCGRPAEGEDFGRMVDDVGHNIFTGGTIIATEKDFAKGEYTM